MDEQSVATAITAISDAFYDIVSPAWIVAGACILVSLLAFHAVLGTTVSRWLSDLPFAIGGFAAGNFVGYLTGWPTPIIGDVHPVEGALGTWLILGAIASISAIAPEMPARLRFRGRIT